MKRRELVAKDLESREFTLKGLSIAEKFSLGLMMARQAVREVVNDDGLFDTAQPSRIEEDMSSLQLGSNNSSNLREI